MNCANSRHRAFFAAALMLGLLACGASAGIGGSSLQTSAGTTPLWQLVWSDEFNGANGSSPDATKWTYDLGGGGWGNQELETYTSRPVNAHVQDGNLVITAQRETFTGTDGITREFTSARLKTLTLFTQTYGKFEARIQIPRGQGMWPAFWLLGSNIDQVDWPACGEIDIMENIGSEPAIVHGTIHGPGSSGAYGISGPYTLPSSSIFADDFHVFATEWDSNAIRFYVDGSLYKSIAPADLPAGAQWAFNHPFFIILNVAVGGSWPGSPDSTTVFPQTMRVDYVRVYKNVAP